MKKLRKVFLKLSPTKKALVEAVADFFGIFFLFTIVYFVFFLRPVINSAKSLKDAKEQLYPVYSLLQQEKVAHMELLNLKTTSLFITDQRNFILKQIEDSETNMANLKEKSEINNIGGKKEIRKLLKDIRTELPKMNEESIKIINDKKPIFEEYKKLSLILQKVFDYNPQTDLSDIAPDIVNERAVKASDGISKISEELKGTNAPENLTVQFYLESSKDISLLKQIAAASEAKNMVRIKSLVGTLTSEYPNLKTEAKKIIDSPLKSPKAVEILKDQTNLILKYEFWINKIDEKQKGLETNPLSNIYQ